MVATDIAARGIHVDDIGLVIHADPPVEHKAYLHRSGRTARAGADGTVITLMTDAQVRDVRDLTRKAGIRPTTTRLSTGHPLLVELAPGERTFAAPRAAATASSAHRRSGRPATPKQAGGGPRNRSRRSSGGRQGGYSAGPARPGGAAAFSTSTRSRSR
jgi:superfamily II DNA/RNA helicase